MLSKNISGVVLAIVLVLFLGACQDRMTCPDFQSRYILDDEYRSNFFSYFDADSLPRTDRTASVNYTWYGIVKETRPRKKARQMNTIEMEMVTRRIEPRRDSIKFDPEDFIQTDSIGGADSVSIVTDSVGVDINSSGSITTTGSDIQSVDSVGYSDETTTASSGSYSEHHYNVEQDMYMLYVGYEYFQARQRAYNEFLQRQEQEQQAQARKDSVRQARRDRIFGVFRRKEKVEEQVSEEEEYDPFLDYGDEETLPAEEDSEEDSDEGDSQDN